MSRSQIEDTSRPDSRSSSSSSGAVPEIRLGDQPLLEHADELRLGHLINAGLRRLRALISHHPDGYRKVLAQLTEASQGRARCVNGDFDREELARDCDAALEILAACERDAVVETTEWRRRTRDGARRLAGYCLQPENVLHLGVEISRSRPAGSDAWLRRLESLTGRVTASVLKWRDELTRSNERLVLREALRYRPRGLRESDLYQEGFIGLQRAALRFDATRRLRFSTYATFWVRQAIRQSLINQSRLIRVPQRTQLQLRKWQNGAKSPLDDREAERVSTVMDRTVTFSFLHDEDESMAEFDRGLWQSGPTFAPGSLPSVIAEGLARLSDRERTIVQRRFGLDGRPSQTLESIGHDLHLSRERVRQLEREAMMRLSRQREFEDAYESVLAAS